MKASVIIVALCVIVFYVFTLFVCYTTLLRWKDERKPQPIMVDSPAGDPAMRGAGLLPAVRP